MNICPMDSPFLLTVLVTAGVVLTQVLKLSFVSVVQQLLVDPAVKI